MGNFDRNRNSRPGGDRGFERRGGFGGRGSRGPVEMHQATCDKCQKSCEVPFRPTSGKPVYCSNCFESNRGSDSRPSYGREDRQMFEAVCDECRNSCKVPFRPSGDKPIYCSNCFGDKKTGGSRGGEQAQCQAQCIEQFEVINNKLDRILAMLIPNAVDKIEDVQPEVETKVAKKKPSKKK